MLLKLMLELYNRNHIKNIAYFAGNALIIALFYLYYSIIYAVRESVGTNGYSSMIRSVISAQSEQSQLLMTVVFVTFLFYCIQSYILMRVPEYISFLIFGMSQKQAYLYLMLESLTGCLISTCIGFVVGIAGGLIIKSAHVWNVYIQACQGANMWVIKKLFFTECIVLIISLTAAFIWMDAKPLNALIRSKMLTPIYLNNRNLILLGIIGVSFVLFGCIEYFLTRYIYIQQFSQILMIAGTLLAGWAFINYGLFLCRNKDTKKCVQLLIADSINQNFNHNLVLIGVLCIITFSVFSTAIPSIALYRTDASEDIRYRYDMVYMTTDKHIQPIIKLAEKYEGINETFPMVRLTVGNGEECIGLPDSAYKILTGKQLKLRYREAVVVIEKWGKQDTKELEKSTYGMLAKNLHAGRSGSRFQESYLPISSVKVITGNVLGKYSPLGLYFSESVAFLSDRQFREVRKILLKMDQEPTYFLGFNFPEKGKQACHALESYINRNDKIQTEEDPDTFQENNYYITIEARRLISMMYTQTLVISMIITVVFLFCSLFILVLKFEIEKERIEHRYRFFKSLGLDDCINRKDLYWEIGAPALIGVILGMLIMIPYLFCASKIPNILDYQNIIVWWIIFIVLYTCIHFLVVLMLRRRIERSIKMHS